MRPESSLLHCPACAAAIPLATFHGPMPNQPDVLISTCRGCGALVEMTWNADAVRMDLAIAEPPSTAPPSTAPARQADPALDLLLAALDKERTEMKQALTAQPSGAKRQMAARRALLASLEAYAAGLGRRGLPVPPRLRDELALQRALRSSARRYPDSR